MRKLLLVSSIGVLIGTSSAFAHHPLESEAGESAASNTQNPATGTSGQAGPRAATQTPTRTAADVITVIGCVQGEPEYRKEIADGKGGAAGTGVGAANEVVLRSLRTVSNDTLQPTGTSGVSANEVYSVTGNLEREIARAAGRQVAVSGYVEVAPSQGTEKVRDLPRLNAAGWHVVSERCDPSAHRR